VELASVASLPFTYTIYKDLQGLWHQTRNIGQKLVAELTFQKLKFKDGESNNIVSTSYRVRWSFECHLKWLFQYFEKFILVFQLFSSFTQKT